MEEIFPVLVEDSSKVFFIQESVLVSFGEDDAIVGEEEAYSILHGSVNIDVNEDIRGGAHAADDSGILTSWKAKCEVNVSATHAAQATLL